MTKIPRRTLSRILSQARIATAHPDEQPLEGQHRSIFETDGDKIGFTDGFRALADKTQVHDRAENAGNHRNRLTHSIEVSRVGRSLGVALGNRMINYYGLHSPTSGEAFWRADPIDIGHIVSAACLAHDIGNPPLGHEGEDAISEFFLTHPTGIRAAHACGPDVGPELQRHEGNAQGFRMLTRSLGWRQKGGLNLTAATLGAFGKYPFPLVPRKRKYGVHRADLETLSFVADRTGMTRNDDGWCRHPLAWAMEAADDICYLTVDLEDAAVMGLIETRDLVALYKPIIGDDTIRSGYRMNDTSRMIQYLRSRMIKTLIDSCVETYVDLAEEIDNDHVPATDYGSGLLANTRHAEAMHDIRTFSRNRIYKSPTVTHTREALIRAMTDKLTRLCDEFADVLAKGDPVAPADIRRTHPELSELPKSSHHTQIPQAPDKAYPWLIDQITLMSDAQIIAQTARAVN